MNEPSSGGPPPLPRKNQTSPPHFAEDSSHASAHSQESEAYGFADQNTTNRGGEQPRSAPLSFPKQVESLPVIHAGDLPRKNNSSVPLIMAAGLTVLFTVVGCIFFIIILWPRPQPMPIPAPVGLGNAPMMPVQINPPMGGGVPKDFPNPTIPKGANPFPDLLNPKDLAQPKAPLNK